MRRAMTRRPTEFGVLTDLYSKRIAERMLDLAGVNGRRPAARHRHRHRSACANGRRTWSRCGRHRPFGRYARASASQRRRRTALAAARSSWRWTRKRSSSTTKAFDVTVSLFVLRHLPNPHWRPRRNVPDTAAGRTIDHQHRSSPEPFSPDSFTSAFGAATDRIQGMLGRRLLAPESLRDFLRQEGLNLGHDHAAHSHLGDVGEMLRSIGFTGCPARMVG